MKQSALQQGHVGMKNTNCWIWILQSNETWERTIKNDAFFFDQYLYFFFLSSLFSLHLFIEIELVSETTEDEAKAAEGDRPELTEGVTVAYTKPAVQVKS